MTKSLLVCYRSKCNYSKLYDSDGDIQNELQISSLNIPGPGTQSSMCAYHTLSNVRKGRIELSVSEKS